jgi:hypothetical protein
MSRSTECLPYLTGYADILRVYTKTKPIRGQGERRPLGRRRDHNAFWIRKHEPTGSFECMCYRTPVVTFHSDNTVTIRNGGYPEATTHSFITELLGRSGVTANGWLNRTRLIVNGHIHMLEKDKSVTLTIDDKERMHLTEVQEMTGYAMNRKAANNVRRKYKEFADYFVGLVKLRTQVVLPDSYRKAFAGNFGYPEKWERRVVSISVQELAEAVGTNAHPDNSPTYTRYVLTQRFNYLGESYGRTWYAKGVMDGRTEQEMAFLSLINPDQPEETKMTNYYKAALLLLLGDRGPMIADKNDPTMLDSNADDAVALYDRALLMSHAKEVLTLTKLAPGKMPNIKYVGWIKPEEA